LSNGNPFEGVQFEPRQSTRYRSRFDFTKLIEEANEELSVKEPEQFKAFLLAAMAGLRRNEIDKLEWDAFQWERGVLRLDVTNYFEGKSEEAISDVDLDQELLALFRGFKAKATGRFVIESKVQPRPQVNAHYRCSRLFTQLNTWLRSKGVKGRTPLHTLRKEYGSQVCDRFGIYAASQALRHSDINVTSQHYLDKKTRITVGLGHLLQPDKSNITELKHVLETTGTR
jgi:integrase